MPRPVNPLGGEPPTGEPYAGDPHVRFGGGSGRVTGCSYPYQQHRATILEDRTILRQFLQACHALKA